MLLMRPALASAADLDWVQGNAEDDLLVVAAIKAALAYPNAHAASLLRQLDGEIDGRLMREIERELHLLDESLDFALEFNGARKHLIETYTQRDQSKLLDTVKEKSLSELTEQERALLKSMSGFAKK
jgi:DNA primase